MTDREILEKILHGQEEMRADIAKMQGDINGMQDDISGMQGDISGMQGDISGIQGDISGMKGDITGMKSDINGMKSDIAGMQVNIAELQDAVKHLDSRVTKLILHVENETDRNICILAENHSMLMDKLTEAIPPVNKEKILDVKVSMLEADFKKVKSELKALKELKEVAS